MKSFEESNKTVHKVEDQWHYPIMMKGGFTAENKEAVGFVRSYKYNHPSGIIVYCNTGINADYWEARTSDGKRLDGGYWSDLEPYLQKLSV